MRQRKDGLDWSQAATAAASHLIRLETRCNVIRDQREREGSPSQSACRSEVWEWEEGLARNAIDQGLMALRSWPHERVGFPWTFWWYLTCLRLIPDWQGAPKVRSQWTRFAYHFCPSLPAAFTQPGAPTLADLCSIQYSICPCINLEPIYHKIVSFYLSHYETIEIGSSLDLVMESFSFPWWACQGIRGGKDFSNFRPFFFDLGSWLRNPDTSTAIRRRLTSLLFLFALSWMMEPGVSLFPSLFLLSLFPPVIQTLFVQSVRTK